MAINKYMHAALKVLSDMEIDLKSNYRVIRQMEHVAKKPLVKTYKTRDIKIGDEGFKVPVRIFYPSFEKEVIFEEIKRPVIIFFHGGGWVTGDLDSYEKVCITTARRTNRILISVEYRLAPEFPFPAAFTDCYRAVKAVMEWNAKSNASHEITLMGDSAGGNLAAAVSLYMRDRGEKTADKQILIYPVTYNSHTGNSPFPSVLEYGTDYLLTSKRICDYTELYIEREEDRNNPYFAPLLTNDFSRQPDTLIITAQYDPLRDEAEEYGRKLKEAGNNVFIHRTENSLHGYFSLPASFAAVKESYDIINHFLKGAK